MTTEVEHFLFYSMCMFFLMIQSFLKYYVLRSICGVNWSSFTLNRNSSLIQTTTPNVSADVIGYQLNVTLTTVHGDQVVVPETYEYRPDPIIVKVYPLDTIAR